MGEEDENPKRRNHIREQIVCMLREADRMLGEYHSVVACVSTWRSLSRRIASGAISTVV